MNILFLCNEFLPEEQGGLGRLVWDLAHEFKAQGHNIFVRGFNAKNRAELIDDIDLAYSRMTPSRIFKRQKNRFHLYHDILDLNKVHPIDIIEVPDFQGLLPYKKVPCPVVVRTHGLDDGGNTHVKHMEKETLMYHPNWISPSERSLHNTVSYTDLHPLEHRMIFNGCGELAAREINLPGEKTHRILFVGKTKHQKGYDKFLEFSTKLKANNPELEFICAGMAEENSDDGITYLGKISHEQLMYCMQHCNALLQLSQREASSMVCAEAMFNKLPIITYFIAPYTEYLTQESATFIMLNDFTENVKRIEAALKDSKVLKQKTEKAYDFAEKHFSIKQCAEHTMKFYKELISCQNC